MKITSTRPAWLASIFILLLLDTATAGEQVADVWKDPNCGCCDDWVMHLEDAGIEVRTFNTGNVDQRKHLGISDELSSCHTVKIGGYVFEGHVPADDIKRFLAQQPRAIGLAVPGMPIGSPGMDGAIYGEREDLYDVLLVTLDGSTRTFQSHGGD